MLKYLFTAVYKDGTTYQQTQEDKSIFHEHGSCYTDHKQDELIAFALTGDGHEYLVDLRDGHFEIDMVPFSMHKPHIEKNEDGSQTAYPLKDFRLIFFRNHTHNINVGKDSNEELSHEVSYSFGWQATEHGKNYQQVMEIK